MSTKKIQILGEINKKSVIAQNTAPDNTDVLWIDTSDNTSDAGVVVYDTTQVLTETEQAQARNNISAAPASHTSDASIHVTDAERTTWNESDVFIATYGTTTYAEIKAAYDAGKAIYCKQDIYVAPLYSIPNSLFCFRRYDNHFIYQYRCSSDNTWIIGQFNYRPDSHASTHASTGSDPITPTNIGAAPASHASDTTIHVTAEEKAAWNSKLDSGLFVVTITNGNGTLSADKTYQEIWNAFLSGYQILACYSDVCLPFIAYSDMFFFGTILCLNDDENGSMVGTDVIMITPENEVYDISAAVDRLPNPNALTIKIGDETVTYDGSEAKTIVIADGSGVSY